MSRLVNLANIYGELGRQETENEDLFGWLDEYELTDDPEDILRLSRTMRVMLSKIISVEMLRCRREMNEELRQLSEGERQPGEAKGRPSRSSWRLLGRACRRSTDSLGACLRQIARSTRSARRSWGRRP